MPGGGGHVSRYLGLRASPARRGSSGGSSACRFVPRGDPPTVSASGPAPVNLGSSGGVSAVRFDPRLGAGGNTPPALIRAKSLSRFATPPGGVGPSPPGTVAPGAMGGGSTPLDEAPGGSIHLLLAVEALVALRYFLRPRAPRPCRFSLCPRRTA